jgi:hypothetical protein
MITIAIFLALALPSVADAQRAVRAELKDPDSAKFRGIKLRKGDDGEPYGYCGWVNYKNSYGGYTGENYFIYNFKKGKVAIIPPGPILSTLCK